MRNKKPSKGFTILEIVIAIAVILILATAVLSGSGGIIRSMRFNNAFNKLVLMVQRGRNLAIANKDTTVEKYSIIISLAGLPPLYPKNTAALVLYKYLPPKLEILEILNLEEASKLYLKTEKAEKADSLACSQIAVIIFKNGISEPVLACDGVAGSLNPANNDIANTLKITLQELDASDKNKIIREKTFSISHLSGIPQLKLE